MSSSPSSFLNFMSGYWVKRLKLECTKPLQQGWAQIEQAVLESSSDNRWRAIQLPTGAGKSSALALLCASYHYMNKLPGTLIVTRFRKDADQIAERINGLRPKPIARAAHSSSEVSVDEMNRTPVLCITHAAYAAALREQQSTGISARLDMYRHHFHSDRRWLIVDEAFDFVDARQIELVELRLLAEHMRRHSAIPVQPDVDLIAAFANELEDQQCWHPEDKGLPQERLRALVQVDWQAFREAVRQTPHCDLSFASDADSSPPNRRKRYLEIIDDLSCLARSGKAWISKRGKRISVHTSQLLLPASFIAGVILDATASVDPTYSTLGSSIKLLPRPDGIRTYSNVKLYLSKGHRLGKGHLARSAEVDWKSLSGQLASEWTGRRSVLVIVHNDVESIVRANPIQGVDTHIAHWGDIDGKNDWSQCDTVVVFGLSYLDDITPTNAFLASSVSADFNDDAVFGSKALSDARWRYKEGFISKSIVQAVNRARCRTVASSTGECEPCDVYLLLPAGELANGVQRAVAEQMPGLSIHTWPLQSSPKKPRRNANRDLLLNLLKSLPAGTYGRRLILDRSGIKERTFQRISNALQDAHTDLSREISKLGVSYTCHIGGTDEAFFTKA